VVGTPNQKIPQAPLCPIPAFDEPFSRILIDCVGPLPKTKSLGPIKVFKDFVVGFINP
jgi:hypothetical protein